MGYKGFVDIPKTTIDEDMLEVKNYIDGLCKFIEHCPTPMTISIQGDWGSGKTSFMNMIKDNLDKNKNIDTVWFNTWQFSQFNLGESLPIIFLTKLIENMTNGVENNYISNLKKYMSTITKATARVLSSVVTSVSRVNVTGVVEKVIEEIDNEDVVNVISKLKDEFKKCVDETLKNNNKSRLVVFIDDLDRIYPAKAIEILEVLKLFVDCEKCIFILAIDYEVVIQGVNQKYGGALNNDKGRNFFDKIIQLPFKMPVAQYKIKNYIENILKEMNISVESVNSYYNLIRSSIGHNPRSIKRLFNAYMLLRIILDVEKNAGEIFDRTLFAVLCMQMAFEDIYNYIVMLSYEEIDLEFFKNISDYEFFEKLFNSRNDDDSNIDIWVKELKLLEDEERSYRICSFMKTFCEAVSEDGKDISEYDIERIFDVFNIASITSVSDIIVDKNKSSKSNRYDHEYDNEFKYYGINEGIEKINKPNGWNSAKIKGYKLFNDEQNVGSFSEAMISILEKLYKSRPEEFMKIKEKPEEYGLKTLFLGARKGGGIVSSGILKLGNEEVKIELKSNYNKKVSDLRKFMNALGYDESELKLCVSLARRK